LSEKGALAKKILGNTVLGKCDILPAATEGTLGIETERYKAVS